jgi:hypothetical protein
MNEDEDKAREADRLVASALYLMTCHARNGCPRIAGIVERHFLHIARNPESGELVRDMCRRLAAAWRAVRQHDECKACANGAHPGLILH